MASPMVAPSPSDFGFLARPSPLPAASGAPATVLLLVPHPAVALAATCVSARHPGMTFTEHHGYPAPGTSVAGHDLIAIDLSGSDGRLLAFGVEALAENPDAEVLFFCDDAASPGAAAAVALGLRSTVIGPGARAWLVAALPALVEAARARRALRRAEAVIPALPRDCATAAAPSALPLPVAEDQFREFYVRGLLAAVGDRARAAKQAGIPYRSLCRILQRVAAVPPRDPRGQK